MDTKKYVSVICEYNPFHFGHQFQMEQLKNNFDGVVCIMSGDIVQRGEVAVASKYLRGKTALANGANLVLELPVPWCCSSARDFASAGVHIAHNIGADYLAFGSEDELDKLLELERLISRESFSVKVKNAVEQNKKLSYPLALNWAVKEELGEEYAEILAKPNNILSLEYISSLKGKNIKPFSVKRNFDFSSSSNIRELGEGIKIIDALPTESKKVLIEELDLDFPRKTEKLDSFVIGELRKMAFLGKPKDIYSMTEDLANKIIDNAKRCNSFRELVAACTDKIYTSARVRRGIISLIFNIKQEQIKALPPYTTVIAADEIGREILKKAKRQTNIPIITKPSKALQLDENVKKAYLFAKYMEDIVALSAPKPLSTDIGKTPLII